MSTNAEKKNSTHSPYEFAILVDSCCDVPEEYIKKYPIYVAPLRINYKEASYRDKIDITPEEIYNNLSVEIPTTSMPTYSDMQDTFKRIIADGYTKIIAINISPNLSGTFNLTRLVSDEFEQEGIETYLFDTRNIALASGMYAISMAKHLEEGKTYKETIQLLESEDGNSKVFFCVETLEYLRKGGRIGRVASALGSVLNLKPIISCDENGIYYTVGKERGSKRCIEKAIMLSKEFASTGKSAEIAIMCAGEVDGLEEIKQKLEQLVPHSVVKIRGQIGPVLGVHVGPGLVGIIVYLTK